MVPSPGTPNRFKIIRLTAICYLVVIAGFVFLMNACRHTESVQQSMTTAQAMDIIAPAVDEEANETAILSVANVIKSEDGNTYQVMFFERAQIFTLDAKKDASLISQLQQALNSGQPLRVVTAPYKGTLLEVAKPTVLQNTAYSTVMKRELSYSATTAKKFSPTDPDIDKPQNIPLPSTTTGLTTIIPDMATAQLMFNYFAQQSCNLPGPFGIDHCISFQYVGDGCYARAHKMGWIIMNKYHYALLKVFSYGSLSVRANKWGGCCVSWWYHVAPLLQVKTSAGVRSYVMDPGMFDQPVLLSDWLSAQKNKGCSSGASVNEYSIQPVSAYWPGAYAAPHTPYGTDVNYTSTNSTLVNYSHLKTCP